MDGLRPVQWTNYSGPRCTYLSRRHRLRHPRREGEGSVSSILITGGAGFFGKAFLRALLAKGETPPLYFGRICVYSRNEWNQAQLRRELEQGDYYCHERVRWMIGDVRDSDRMRRAMEGVD